MKMEGNIIPLQGLDSENKSQMAKKQRQGIVCNDKHTQVFQIPHYITNNVSGGIISS